MDFRWTVGRTHTESDGSPAPEFKSPATPHLFIMDETPYLELIKKVLQHEETR